VELGRQLSKIPEVAQFDKTGEPQGHELAHALSHWEDSFATFLDKLCLNWPTRWHLPKI
jgi:hypothetical protein